jgi:type I restriction enzyme S subunit
MERPTDPPPPVTAQPKQASLVERLRTFLDERYKGESPKIVAVREHVLQICADFVASGLADPDFESELCSGSEARFWQRFTEAFLASELRRAGLRLVPTRSGPDFNFEHDRKRVRIEAICPDPKDIPEDWLADGVHLQVVTFPHPEILLRWTAAINAKSAKFLGSASGPGYLAKGLVGSDDVCVVAVNGRQLRGLFPTINGISGFPFALEAVFPVGPRQITIDRASLKQTGSGHQHRPLIAKSKGAPVSAEMFLDPAFEGISAVWANDFGDLSPLGGVPQTVVIHNPLAKNPLPLGVLPVQWEYVAVPSGPEEYTVTRHRGRLAPPPEADETE